MEIVHLVLFEVNWSNFTRPINVQDETIETNLAVDEIDDFKNE